LCCLIKLAIKVIIYKDMVEFTIETGRHDVEKRVSFRD